MTVGVCVCLPCHQGVVWVSALALYVASLYMLLGFAVPLLR